MLRGSKSSSSVSRSRLLSPNVGGDSSNSFRSPRVSVTPDGTSEKLTTTTSNHRKSPAVGGFSMPNQRANATLHAAGTATGSPSSTPNQANHQRFQARNRRGMAVQHPSLNSGGSHFSSSKQHSNRQSQSAKWLSSLRHCFRQWLSSMSTAMLLITWVLSAVIGTIVNKRVMKEFPFPIAFTALHLLVGSLMDYLILLNANLKKVNQSPPLSLKNVRSSHRDIPGGNSSIAMESSFKKHSHSLASRVLFFQARHFYLCSWNGVWFALSKYLTYVSYGKVPLSLTHTVKSSGPVFSVLVNAFYTTFCDSSLSNRSNIHNFIRGQASRARHKRPLWPPTNELLTLIPITVGVTMSAVHEINFELIGFLAAVLATLLGVFQNVTSKQTLSDYRGIISPMALHMYGSLLALIFLLPLCLFREGPDLYKQYYHHYDKLTDGVDQAIHPADMLHALKQHSDEYDSHPLFSITFSCVCLYIQTMASLFLLKRVSTVTHQVANTSKRFFIIVSSVLYFGNEVSLWNACGIALALLGFFLYQKSHKMNSSKKTSKDGPMSSSVPPYHPTHHHHHTPGRSSGTSRGIHHYYSRLDGPSVDNDDSHSVDDSTDGEDVEFGRSRAGSAHAHHSHHHHHHHHHHSRGRRRRQSFDIDENNSADPAQMDASREEVKRQEQVMDELLIGSKSDFRDATDAESEFFAPSDLGGLSFDSPRRFNDSQSLMNWREKRILGEKVEMVEPSVLFASPNGSSDSVSSLP